MIRFLIPLLMAILFAYAGASLLQTVARAVDAATHRQEVK